MLRLLGRSLRAPVAAVVTDRRIVVRGLKLERARGLRELMALVPRTGLISVSNLAALPHWNAEWLEDSELRFLAGTMISGSRAALVVLDSRLRGPLTPTERAVLTEFAGLAESLLRDDPQSAPKTPVLSAPNTDARASGQGLLELARLSAVRVDASGAITELVGASFAALGLTTAQVGKSTSEVFAQWPALTLAFDRALEGYFNVASLEPALPLELHCRPVRLDGMLAGAVGALFEIGSDDRARRSDARFEGGFSDRIRSVRTEDATLEDAKPRAIAEERARIAREMHDGFGKDVFGLAMILESLAESQRGRALQSELVRHAQTARRLGHEARALTQGLRQVAPVGLAQRARDVAAQFQSEQPGSPRTHISLPEHLPELDGSAVHELSRVIREALENVRRHARARNVWVSLGLQDRQMVLWIDDDGRGFAALSAPGRYGVLGMRERVELLGGRFALEPSPRGGVRVEARVPLDGIEEHASRV